MNKHYFFKVTYFGNKKILKPIPGQTDNTGDPIIPGKSIASYSKYRPDSGTIAVSDGFHYRESAGYYSTYNIRNLDDCSDKIKEEYESLIKPNDVWVVSWMDYSIGETEGGPWTIVKVFSSEKKAVEFTKNNKENNYTITKHKLDSSEQIEIY